MVTIRMTPGRRLQLAGAGYLLLYVCSQWQPRGVLSSVVAALICLVFALVLFRAAAPEPLKPEADLELPHPIQAGKDRLLRRNRALRPSPALGR